MRFFIPILSIAILIPIAANAAGVQTIPLVSGAEARTSTPVARTTARIDYNCPDFPTHAAAQAAFISAGGPASDPYRLDGDKDGSACEDLP